MHEEEPYKNTTHFFLHFFIYFAKYKLKKITYIDNDLETILQMKYQVNAT